MFPSGSFRILSFTFRPITDHELIFEYVMREVLDLFIFLCDKKFVLAQVDCFNAFIRNYLTAMYMELPLVLLFSPMALLIVFTN